MQKKGKRILILIFSFLLSIIWNVPASAFIWMEPVSVGSVQELQKWYYDKDVKASESCRLTQDIVIDTTVILSDVSKIREIGAIDYKIRVTKTGQLILNNPTVFLSGPGEEPAIEVEAGGRLELNQGKCYMPADITSVFVHKGGFIKKTDQFDLNGSFVVQEGSNNTIPSTPTDESTDSDNSNGGGDGSVLPPPLPDDEKTGPISDLAARVASVGSTGRVTITLIFSPLPTDIEKLYVYYSKDGVHYTKGKWLTTSSEGYQWKEDFLEQPGYSKDTPVKHVAYRDESDWDYLWLKIEVIGSSAEGMSNVVKIKREAGSQSNEGEIWEDGSFDGNRGGGGQGISSRETTGNQIDNSKPGDQAQEDHLRPNAGGFNYGTREPKMDKNEEMVISGMNITESNAEALDEYSIQQKKGLNSDSKDVNLQEITGSEGSGISSLGDEGKAASAASESAESAYITEKKGAPDGIGAVAAATVILVSALSCFLHRKYKFKKDS